MNYILRNTKRRSWTRMKKWRIQLKCLPWLLLSPASEFLRPFLIFAWVSEIDDIPRKNKFMARSEV